MKSLIKAWIGKVGYLLLKKQFMPLGVSLPEDLSRQVELSRIATVFDIGANKGSITRYFRDIFPQAVVHAFEPASSTYKQLEAGCAALSRVHTYNFAFTNQRSTMRMYLQSDSGLNSLTEGVNKPDSDLKGQSENVKVETLDEFCKKEGITQIDFLKTDTEGLDLKVLEGAEGLIRSGKIRFILSEVGFTPENKRNTFFETLRVYLAERNYKLSGFYWQSDFDSKACLTSANALFSLRQ